MRCAICHCQGKWYWPGHIIMLELQLRTAACICQHYVHGVVCLFIGVLGRVDYTGHFAPITYTLTNQRDE